MPGHTIDLEGIVINTTFRMLNKYKHYWLKKKKKLSFLGKWHSKGVDLQGRGLWSFKQLFDVNPLIRILNGFVEIFAALKIHG